MGRIYVLRISVGDLGIRTAETRYVSTVAEMAESSAEMKFDCFYNFILIIVIMIIILLMVRLLVRIL